MPREWQISSIVSGLSSANLIAVRIFLSECFSFLPPFLPLALAAANPAKVLSRIICLSNESKAKARRPVVRAEDAKHQLAATRCRVDCFGQADKPNSSAAKIFNQCQQMFEGTSQPVKPPHNQLLFGYYSHPSSPFTIRNILEKFTTAPL